VTYLIDSDWLIDATIGRLPALQLINRLRLSGVSISVISVAELTEGTFRAPEPASALVSLQEFLSTFPTYPITVGIAETFAATRAALRQQGLLIPDMDLLIAATALEHDLTLVTRNQRHFARIPGLQIQ
jgi:tRNA(fMet)-specific endonuclease VapC